ncbi:MAG: hypothetical protein AAFN07_04940 [Pseudomonadota bacterium]
MKQRAWRRLTSAIVLATVGALHAPAMAETSETTMDEVIVRGYSTDVIDFRAHLSVSVEAIGERAGEDLQTESKIALEAILGPKRSSLVAEDAR